MDHKQTAANDQEDRVMAYRASFAIAEKVAQNAAQRHPDKYLIKGTQAVRHATARIQAWEMDRLLGKPCSPDESVRAIAVGALTARDQMQVHTFHSFFRCAVVDSSVVEAFGQAIVKSSDDEFDKIWKHPERRRAFRKWLGRTDYHSQPKTYDFEQHYG